MSAVKVMRALLLGHAPLTLLVEPKNIVAGAVPQGASLPAVGIKEIGSNEFKTVSQREPGSLVRARIQVTVYTKTYSAQKTLIHAAKLGRGVMTGLVTGIKVRSVVRGDIGPDFEDTEAGIFEQSRDFMVSYIEPN